MLSEKQVEEYKENGFVIMDYSLPKETLDEIKYYHKNLFIIPCSRSGKYPFTDCILWEFVNKLKIS